MESNARKCLIKIMSVNLRLHVICSKMGGTWVEVVFFFFLSFFLIFARHIEWLYSKNL